MATGRSSQPNEGNLQGPAAFGWRFWILVCATGVLSGVAGMLLMGLLAEAQHLTWDYRHGTFLEAVWRASALHRVVALTIAGVVVGIGRLLLKHHARGHGGDLTAAIWLRGGEIPFDQTLVRSALSVTVVGMGATVGREGALKQAGAAFASLLSGKWHLPPAQRRVLAACGAAGGFASAYNVPFGAAVFAMEVLLGTFSLELIPPVTLASLIAAGVSRVMLSSAPTYHVPPYLPNASLYAWACVAGPVLGVVSAGFVKTFAWMDTLRPQRRGVVAFPLSVMIGLGVISIWLPWLLGNGKDTVQEALLGHLSVSLLVALAVLKLFLTGISMASGISGGLMTPTLCFGALLSGALARAWLGVWPGTTEGALVMIGMGTVLAGTTHGPISAIILVGELTGDAGLTAPLALSTSLALVMARLLDRRSIYTARLHEVVRSATAAGPVVTPAAQLSTTVRLLLLRQQEVPVVNAEGEQVGRIDREAIEQLPRSGVPERDLTAADVMRP